MQGFIYANMLADFENAKEYYTKFLEKYPNHEFYWLMGADSIIDFHLWEEWQEIINLTNLIIGNRDGYFFKARKSIAYQYAESSNKCVFLRIKKVNISSTELRSDKVL